MKKSEVREDILGMAEAFYRRGCEDSAHNIAKEIYDIIERHKNEDWRDLIAVLEKHLKEGSE